MLLLLLYCKKCKQPVMTGVQSIHLFSGVNIFTTATKTTYTTKNRTKFKRGPLDVATVHCSTFQGQYRCPYLKTGPPANALTHFVLNISNHNLPPQRVCMQPETRRVHGPHCLGQFVPRDHGFESHLGHTRMCKTSFFVLWPCDRRIPHPQSPILRLKRFKLPDANSQTEQFTKPNPFQTEKCLTL